MSQAPRALREEIEHKLECESPSRISLWLRNQNVYISERSLRNYRNNVLGPRKALSHGSLLSTCGEIVYQKIDALQALYGLVRLQMERVNMGLQSEQLEGR